MDEIPATVDFGAAGRLASCHDGHDQGRCGGDDGDDGGGVHGSMGTIASRFS